MRLFLLPNLLDNLNALDLLTLIMFERIFRSKAKKYDLFTFFINYEEKKMDVQFFCIFAVSKAP